MSLQDLLNSPKKGIVDLRGRTFTLDTPLVISAPLRILGGGDCILEIKTPPRVPAIKIESGDVTIQGVTIRHVVENPLMNLGCVEVRGKNVEITGCRIEYLKSGVYGTADHLKIENTHFHHRLPAESTCVARAISLDGFREGVVVRGCVHTTEGNARMEGLTIVSRSNSSKAGTILYEGNRTEGFRGVRKWINFDVGAETGLEDETIQLEVRNNHIETSNASIMIIQPAFSTSLYRFEKIQFEGNEFSEVQNILEVSAMYSGCTSLGEPPTTTPFIFFEGNRGYREFLKFSSYKKIPATKFWQEGIPKIVLEKQEEETVQKRSISPPVWLLILIGVSILLAMILYGFMASRPEKVSVQKPQSSTKKS